MPSVLSKLSDLLLLPEWSFPFNCYEIGHSWEPSCSASSLELSLLVTEKALKMYSGLYLFNLLVSRNYSVESVGQTLNSVLRSSAFLGFNCLGMFATVCVLRKLTGRFYYSLFSTIPAPLGSFMAILIEQPSRRRALAFYCANIATECLFRIAAKRGRIYSLPHGEVILFTFSISLLLYIARIHGLRNDPVGLAVKILLGSGEFRSRRPVKHPNDQSSSESTCSSYACSQTNQLSTGQLIPTSKHNSSAFTVHSDANFNQVISPKAHSIHQNSFLRALTDLRHPSCCHRNSCFFYCFRGFSESFMAAWLGQTALHVAMKSTRVMKDPGLIYRSLTNPKKAKLSLFMSLFTLIFRTCNCTLRWKTGKREDWHNFVAGLLAGPSMLFQPNSVVASNMIWKCIENGVDIAEKKGLPIKANSVIPLIYALSVNTIFYTLVLEPDCLRPSLIRFIDQMTDHKLHQVNRGLLSLFGTNAHAGYEDFFPDLDPKQCSPQFIETVLVWMLR